MSIASAASLRRLVLVATQVANDALRTIGFARLAHITSVKDQPVVSVLLELERYDLLKFVFHGTHVFARRETSAVGDAKNMCVHGNRGVAKSGVEDDIRGFAADARQRLQSLASLWHLAAVLVHQNAAQRDHVLGLAVEQADGGDIALELLLAHIEDRLRRVRDWE